MTLSRQHKRLEELKNSDKYWPALDEFKQALKAKLYDKEHMVKMNRSQLLRFLGWCSSYRPVEPHIVLIKLGSYADSA